MVEMTLTVEQWALDRSNDGASDDEMRYILLTEGPGLQLSHSERSVMGRLKEQRGIIVKVHTGFAIDLSSPPGAQLLPVSE